MSRPCLPAMRAAGAASMACRAVLSLGSALRSQSTRRKKVRASTTMSFKRLCDDKRSYKCTRAQHSQPRAEPVLGVGFFEETELSLSYHNNTLRGNNECARRQYLTRGPPPAPAPPPRGASRRRTSRSRGLRSRSRTTRRGPEPPSPAASARRGGRRRTRRTRRRRTRDNLGYTRSPAPTSASTCPRVGAYGFPPSPSSSVCRSAAAPARATTSREEPS